MTALTDATRGELLDAWVAWDDKAARTPKRPPQGWLTAETGRLVDVLDTAAAELGWWSPTELHAALAKRRRVGDTHQAAVGHVEALDPHRTPGTHPTVQGDQPHHHNHDDNEAGR